MVLRETAGRAQYHVVKRSRFVYVAMSTCTRQQAVGARGLCRMSCSRKTLSASALTITNIQKHCICRRPESGVMPHGTAQHWTITSYLFHIHAPKQLFSRQDWLAVSPMTSENVLVPSCHNFHCTVYLCRVLCYVFILLTFYLNVIHSNHYKIYSYSYSQATRIMGI